MEAAHKNWAPILPQLGDTYLAWRYSGREQDEHQDDPAYAFTIDVLDIYSVATSTNISRSPDQSAAEALVQHGYLRNSPVNPSIAISLKTLELFRLLKLVKSSFSAEAFAKLLCLLYYVSELALQASIAFDA